MRHTSNTCAKTSRASAQIDRSHGMEETMESESVGLAGGRALAICSTTSPTASLDASTTEIMPPHSPLILIATDIVSDRNDRASLA